MIIGVPKEIKPSEGRVGLTPSGVKQIVELGSEVRVEIGAGEKSGFADADYASVGAKLVETALEVYESEIIIKVKEPLAAEYEFMREGQVVFGYLHLAANEELTRALLEQKVTAVAFETIEKKHIAYTSEVVTSYPLLEPMSVIAGQLATINGAYHMQAPHGGGGVLLGKNATLSSNSRAIVFGAGVVGMSAARAAAGLGAHVTVLDINQSKLDLIKQTAPPNLDTQLSTPEVVRELLPRADLIIGAVLVSGAHAPKILTREDLKLLKPSAVLVDVAIDQGGCFETSRPTTHLDPVFEVDGILHYCVANMPGAAPVTATRALEAKTLPVLKQFVQDGWRESLLASEGLACGLNTFDGVLAQKPVAEMFGLPFKTPAEMLAGNTAE